MFHPYKANIFALNVHVSPNFGVFECSKQGRSSQGPVELFDGGELDCDADKAAFTKTACKLLSRITERARVAAVLSDRFSGACANRPGGLMQAIIAFPKSDKHSAELA